MFEIIKTMIADLFDHSIHDSTHDTEWSSDSWSNDSVHTGDSGPDFQNAFGTGADFIVPSDADSAFPNFDYTETTYGPGPGSDFDYTSSSHEDWSS
jgi:hypothetical protein